MVSDNFTNVTFVLFNVKIAQKVIPKIDQKIENFLLEQTGWARGIEMVSDNFTHVITVLSNVKYVSNIQP